MIELKKSTSINIMEDFPTTIAPSLFINMVTSIFIYAGQSLLNLGYRYKPLRFIRYTLVSTFLFFLQLLPSFHEKLYNFPAAENKTPAVGKYAGDSGIARALTQLLSIMNDVPVSSRKYEIVRDLAEKIIDDNVSECYSPLDDINAGALTASFARTLSQLENRVCVIDDEIIIDSQGQKGSFSKWSRVARAGRYCFESAWSRMGLSEVNSCGKSGEKLAAELLWLAQKLEKCGRVEEAVERWGSATKLAWLALSAEPRLQCSLVKISVFLFKQAKEIGSNKEDNEESRERQKQTKIKLLLSWLPLLCRATNGTDAPVLSFSEKTEMERVLEEIIEALSDEEQETVLSVWLHHYIHCPTSDWPNLQDCYSRWCTTSRRLLIIQ